MTECLFCRIAAGELPSEVVYEDDEILAFRDIHPQAPVHILVIPREHIPTLLEAEPGHTELLGKLQQTAVGLARQEGIAEQGFRLVTNCLEGAGQAVFHLHLHLLGGRAMGWPPG